MEQQEPIQLPDLDWEAMPTEELLDRYGIIRSNAGVAVYQMNKMDVGSKERIDRNAFVLKCYENTNKIKAILLTRLIP